MDKNKKESQKKESPKKESIKKIEAKIIGSDIVDFGDIKIKETKFDDGSSIAELL